jgi:exodeoxyribonuclease-5
MTVEAFQELILSNLPYEANSQQVQVVAALARFCSPNAAQESVFVLNGYAGTGKTSLTGALVKALQTVNIQTILLAPTGRAAKVFGAYAGRPAYTIHRKIYRHNISGANIGYTEGMVQQNNNRNTIFIVDEASMIGVGNERGGNVLEDLIQYVYTGDNCRLILLGDTAQLPPVGANESPAMNRDVLRSFGLKVTRATLTETARQSRDSGILYNATMLRRAMAAGQDAGVPHLRIDGFDDVMTVSGEDLPEYIDQAYRRDGIEDTIVITRSNRTAVDFNRAIRQQVLYLEEELSRGELLIVAKNDYYWCRPVKGLEFIANGDIVTISRVYGTEAKYGFRFADVRLSLLDRDVEFDAKLMLETIYTDVPHLTQERSDRLYYSILNDANLFSPDMPFDLRAKKLRDNPHWNALTVKYAYAVTCHKSQGGQWSNVFIDLSYIPADALGTEFYRWLYTAVTRARKHLYLIAPPDALLQ